MSREGLRADRSLRPRARRAGANRGRPAELQRQAEHGRGPDRCSR